MTVLLTSSYDSFRYLDQYLAGISLLKQISDKTPISLAFGSISDTYTKEQHQEIFERVKKTCIEAGIGLNFYAASGQNYSQTIGHLIENTLGFAENYAIWNDDDVRNSVNLLAQIETLKTSLFTYSDFISVNNIFKVIENYKLLESGDLEELKKIEGLCISFEPTYEQVDLLDKRRYFSQFKYGCFISWKAILNVKYGAYSEELKSAADFDWVNRLIYHNVPFTKTKDCLAGAFLSIGEGISTRPNSAGISEGYFLLERYLNNKHPCIIQNGEKVLWRNL